MLKPILFNTEMVNAIQEGRKTQTRRLIKDFAGEEITSILKPDGSYGKYGTKGWRGMLPDRGDGNEYCIEVRPPCEPGDILWVRETWQHVYNFDDNDQPVEESGRYIYYADSPMPFDYWVDPDTGEHKEQMPWKPSIHMPKEAARIFLRVKDVRVERLQDISVLDAINEGCCGTICDHPDASPTLGCTDCLNTGWLEPPDAEFAQLWDCTIKPADREWYGWDANPWVWVIEFERCGKPEGWCT